MAKQDLGARKKVFWKTKFINRPTSPVPKQNKFMLDKKRLGNEFGKNLLMRWILNRIKNEIYVL